MYVCIRTYVYVYVYSILLAADRQFGVGIAVPHVLMLSFQTVGSWEIYSVLSVLLLLDIIILVSWQVLDPLHLDVETFALELPTNTHEDIRLQPQLEHCMSNNITIWLGVWIFTHNFSACTLRKNVLSWFTDSSVYSNIGIIDVILSTSFV